MGDKTYSQEALASCGGGQDSVAVAVASYAAVDGERSYAARAAARAAAEAAEDAEDWAVAIARMNEPETSLADFKAELKARGEI